MIVIIPSFVVFFSPDARWRFEGSSDVYYSPVNNKPVKLYGTPITLGEFSDAYKEARLNHFIRSGGRSWPDSDENAVRNLERDTIFRVLLVRKLADLDIHVTEQAVARLARERIGDIPYATFVKDYLEAQGGLTSADFERYALHETGIQQLAAVAALPSRLINPREAETLYRKDNQEVAAEVAVFWATNFLDQVAVSPDAITKFYSNRMARYRVPARIQLSYLEFPATNFLAEADRQMAQRTNLNAVIDEQYFRRGTNAFTDTNGVALTEADAKAKIKEEIREQFGLIEARKRASACGSRLLEDPQPNRLENFDKLAADSNLVVQVSPPFDRYRGLEDTELPAEFYRDGFQLTQAAPIRYQPIVGERAVYLIALKTNLPFELPPLEKIRDKVTLDFQQDQALTLARAAGASFHKALTNGLAQKKSFKNLCLENKVKSLTLPYFSPSTRSLTNLDERISLQTLQRYAFELKPGEASQFVTTSDGGMIIHLIELLPFDEAKVKAELPDFMATFRSARMNDSFNAWFRKQAEQAQLVLPQKETPPPTPGSPPPAPGSPPPAPAPRPVSPK